MPMLPLMVAFSMVPLMMRLALVRMARMSSL